MKTTIVAVVLVLISLNVASTQELNLEPCLLYDASGRLLPPNTTGIYPCATEGWFTAPVCADPLNLVQVGSLVAPMYYTMTGGDSDADSLFEVYMYIKDNVPTWTFTYRIYENNGQNVYNQAFAATEGLIPYTYGDQDNDGLPEVIGQNGSQVDVWESPAAGHLATQRIWQSPPVVNVTGYTATGDLDEDNLGEIIHTSNSFGGDNRLIVWECTGNNQYQEVFNQWVSDYNLGTKAIADFDGDGLMEIAFSSGDGDVYVLESNGNNSLQQIYRGDMNAWNAYVCSYADDMDGNGRPEFICSGSSSSQGWVSQIYEATGNNAFIVRQTITIWDGFTGVPGNTVGDFDHDGMDEFIIQTAQALHVYEWNGNTYAEVQTIPENFGSILHGVFAYDGDHDAYDEAFWLGLGDGGYWTNETIILENQTATLPNVSIQMTPINPPIIIPATGGSFSFIVEITNNDSLPRTFGTWVMVTLPNGQLYGPVISVAGIMLPAGATLTRTRTQYVPLSAPEGQYSYTGYVGDYPGVVYDSSFFTFMKVCDRDENIAVGDWSNAGEEFDLVDFGGGRTPALQPERCNVTVSPNPFNPTTVISFELRVLRLVQLEVFDVQGRNVSGSGTTPTTYGGGVHQIPFDGSALQSGVYFYRLQVGAQLTTGKMVLLK